MAVAQLTDKLYEAVENGDIEIVRKWMNKGANVNLVSRKGRTALGCASELGHLSIVCLLLDAGKLSTSGSGSTSTKISTCASTNPEIPVSHSNDQQCVPKLALSLLSRSPVTSCSKNAVIQDTLKVWDCDSSFSSNPLLCKLDLSKSCPSNDCHSIFPESCHSSTVMKGIKQKMNCYLSSERLLYNKRDFGENLYGTQKFIKNNVKHGTENLEDLGDNCCQCSGSGSVCAFSGVSSNFPNLSNSKKHYFVSHSKGVHSNSFDLHSSSHKERIPHYLNRFSKRLNANSISSVDAPLEINANCSIEMLHPNSWISSAVTAQSCSCSSQTNHYPKYSPAQSDPLLQSPSQSVPQCKSLPQLTLLDQSVEISRNSCISQEMHFTKNTAAALSTSTDASIHEYSPSLLKNSAISSVEVKTNDTYTGNIPKAGVVTVKQSMENAEYMVNQESIVTSPEPPDVQPNIGYFIMKYEDPAETKVRCQPPTQITSLSRSLQSPVMQPRHTSIAVRQKNPTGNTPVASCSNEAKKCYINPNSQKEHFSYIKSLHRASTSGTSGCNVGTSLSSSAPSSPMCVGTFSSNKQSIPNTFYIYTDTLGTDFPDEYPPNITIGSTPFNTDTDCYIEHYHHSGGCTRNAPSVAHSHVLVSESSDSEEEDYKVSFGRKKIRRCKKATLHRQAERTDSNECFGSRQSQNEESKNDTLRQSNWSVTQWYNSKWALELRAHYEAVGTAWPWSLGTSCDCNVLDAKGSSALHYAAQAGRDHVVAVLLAAGADVDRVDGEELTALHLAAQRGLVKVVDTLLQHGAQVNSRGPDKESALHMAASRGHLAVVEQLLQHGCRIDCLDSSDRTPLLLAASRGHLRTVRLLLQRGAAVNVREIHGYTALCEAVWQQHTSVVSLLLSFGARAPPCQHLLHHALQRRQHAVARLLLEHGWQPDGTDDNGDTPLIGAAKTSSPDMVRLLLEYGAQPRGRHGVSYCTAMHAAVEATRDDLHTQFQATVNALVQAGAKMGASAQLEGDTPLFRALLLAKHKAAEMLIIRGCNVRAPTPVSGVELLRVAVYGNCRRLAMQLVLAGCPLYPCYWLEGGPSAFPPGSLHHTLATLRSSPLRLSDLSRIAVRMALGERIVEHAPLLPLPPLLRSALLLSDIDDYNMLEEAEEQE